MAGLRPAVNQLYGQGQQSDGNNMALRIAGRDRSQALTPGNALYQNVNISTRSASFPLSARMYTPQDFVTAGTFQSVMNVELTWQ